MTINNYLDYICDPFLVEKSEFSLPRKDAHDEEYYLQ